MQADNPADKAEVKQEAKQVQNLPSGSQGEEQTVGYSSSGAIAGTQTTQQNGTASTNSFSGSTVSEQQGCTDGTCTQGPPPPPPPPPPPADWVVFNWSGGDGTTVNQSPFAVTATAPVVFSVTDVFCAGDRFTISDGATTLGTTSVPGRNACDTQLDIADPAVAFTDPAYSHGTFALAAGGHSVGIVASTSPFGPGGCLFQRRSDDAGALHRRQVADNHLAGVRERGELPRVRRSLTRAEQRGRRLGGFGGTGLVAGVPPVVARQGRRERPYQKIWARPRTQPRGDPALPRRHSACFAKPS